jgi:hypothetical protein
MVNIGEPSNVRALLGTLMRGYIYRFGKGGRYLSEGIRKQHHSIGGDNRWRREIGKWRDDL